MTRSSLLSAFALCSSIGSLFTSIHAVVPEEYFGGVNNAEYVAWTKKHGATYNASDYFPSLSDPSEGAALHWTIEGDELVFALACRAKGWMAFGLSENGGMKGSDVTTFTAQNPNELTDQHILDVRVPVKDDCQNWNLVSSNVLDSFLIIEARRKLDTGDPQDIKIVRDDDTDIPSHRVIFAWGDDPSVTNHGSKRVSSSLRFYRFGEDVMKFFREDVKEKSDGFFEVRSMDHVIKPIDTEYARVCVSRQEILDQMGRETLEGMTIIGFETIVDPRAKEHVHHLVINGVVPDNDGVACKDYPRQGQESLLAWAVGGEPFLLPSDVGVSMGEKGFSSYVMIIHYDNPLLKEGVLDSSGVKIYITDTPRKHEMGMFKLGDPLFALSGEPVGTGLTEHVFDCPGSCTNFALPEPVTVFREHVHLHGRGVHVHTNQMRSGDMIHSSNVNFFDFNQQGFMPIQQKPYVVNPGDSFHTVCNYESGSTERVFGFSAKQEMCLIALMYYPRQTKFAHCGRDFAVADCAANYTARNLTSASQTDRLFGKAPVECVVEVSATDKTSEGSRRVVGIFSVFAALGVTGGVWA